MKKLQIFPCTTESAEQLRSVSIDTFSRAFAAQNNPDDFARYLEKAFGLDQLKSELQHPDMHFYFARLGKDLVAYFKLNTHDAQTELQEAEGLEIERIYVLPEWQGQGIGGQLLEAIRKFAVESGKHYIWLGVWEQNPKAIAFYERAGFHTFGKHPYYIGSDRQMDRLMRLDL